MTKERKIRQRWVIEGEWSGYRLDQQHLAHRSIVFTDVPYRNVHGIRFHDGTLLVLRLRPLARGQRITSASLIHGYDELIQRLGKSPEARGIISVLELETK